MGLTFDDGLVSEIVFELRARNAALEGALPFLEFTLTRLYAAREGTRLTRRAYEAMGGVEGAIGSHADALFAGIAAAHGEAADAALGRVFLPLTNIDLENGKATRRRATQSDLPGDPPALALWQAFVAGRLLQTGNSDGVVYIEVAHEALFRSWERLKDWIAEAQEDLILLRQVRTAAHGWQTKREREAEKDFDYLRWPAERLTLVYAMQERLKPELNEVERDFIEPEQNRLLREIEVLHTDHKRRRWIGELLATIGDQRTDIGLDEHGLPQIDWLLVTPGGQIEIEGKTFDVQPFYVARYLITYRQFQAFLDAPDGFEDERWWDGMPDGYKPQAMSTAVAQYDNYPRDSVSWYQSVAFARWLNAKYQEHGLLTQFGGGDWTVRLPTEWEWQWMAQGGSAALMYPWGDWDEHPRANTTEAGIGDRSTAVGMYPHGSAHCGALDVAGNLWEWCLNDKENPQIIDGYSNGKSKVLRGGSFNSSQNFAAASYRTSSIRTSGTSTTVCGWGRALLAHSELCFSGARR